MTIRITNTKYDRGGIGPSSVNLVDTDQFDTMRDAIDVVKGSPNYHDGVFYVDYSSMTMRTSIKWDDNDRGQSMTLRVTGVGIIDFVRFVEEFRRTGVVFG